tara:strand:+ start:182 stop:370 length:189 start_codon:yes stop_codon:yes gene_type:complete
MSDGKMMFMCDRCGKYGYNSKKAVQRHKKRSRICKGIKKLDSEKDISKVMEKLGMIIVDNKR